VLPSQSDEWPNATAAAEQIRLFLAQNRTSVEVGTYPMTQKLGERVDFLVCLSFECVKDPYGSRFLRKFCRP
jgi:hypothetical protein